MAKVIKWHRLDSHTLIAEMDICLAVVHVNDKGEIVRVVTFGEKEQEDQ